MDFARIRLRLTSVANFFSCFLSGGERSEASEEEKLTCNPTVPVADEHELDLWDIMADIAGWRRQRKERKMEKKREEALKRDTVDISYGKVDRRRTGQHASVYGEGARAMWIEGLGFLDRATAGQ